MGAEKEKLKPKVIKQFKLNYIYMVAKPKLFQLHYIIK